MPIASFAGSTYVYDAFGNLAAEYGGDPTSALDFFNVRYFSGAPGRFQSPDPGNAGADPSNPQGWNGYAHVGNNPLSYTDPTGMFVEAGGGGGDDGDGAAGAIVTGVVDFFEWLFGGGPPSSIAPSLATPSSPITGPTFSVTGWGTPDTVAPSWSPVDGMIPEVIPGLLFFAQATSTLPSKNGARVCTAVPTHPPNASLAANASEAMKLRWLLPPLKEAVFYLEVRNGSPWDYKQSGRTLNDFGKLTKSPYLDFGNFNFGVVGAAAGFPSQELLRAAGFAQGRAGTSSPEHGHWYSLKGPYGDDPADQAMIRAGIAYYESGCVR